MPTFLEHLEIFQFHKVDWFWHQTSKSNAWKYLVIMKSVKSSGETCVYPDEAPDFLSSKSFFSSEMWYFLQSQLWLKLSWVPETISQPFPTVKTLYYRQICLETCQGTNWAPHTSPSTDPPHCWSFHKLYSMFLWIPQNFTIFKMVTTENKMYFPKMLHMLPRAEINSLYWPKIWNILLFKTESNGRPPTFSNSGKDLHRN